MNCIITFTDGGQDFTEWRVEKDRVVGCQPFQSSVWVGSRVLNCPELGVGKLVQIRTKPPHRDVITIRYPIETFQVLPDAFGYEADIEIRTGMIAGKIVHRHFYVKSYAAAMRRARLVPNARRILKVMPLTEEEYCRAHGDPRDKSRFN